MPVVFSPLIMAHGHENAPLYLGSNDGCRLTPPRLEILNIFSGIKCL